MSAAALKILKTHDCPLCGAPLTIGVTGYGEKVELDLQCPVYALIGGAKPLIIVRTDMAVAKHQDVCPYRGD